MNLPRSLCCPADGTRLSPGRGGHLRLRPPCGGVRVSSCSSLNPQMSESRVSSVIQEWAYPGQPHPHNPDPSGHEGSSNQLPHMDMIPYGQAQGLVRGGAEDRAAEQMMGLSYQPYSSSCLRSGAASTQQQQHHSSTQQVKTPPSEGPPRDPPPTLISVFCSSRTSPCSSSPP